MIPSSPRARAASKNARPSASMCSLSRTRGSARSTPSSSRRRVFQRLVEQRPAVELEQVEHLVHERRRHAAALPVPLIRAWSRAKSGSPRSSSAITSPSTIACVGGDPVGGCEEVDRNSPPRPAGRGSRSGPPVVDHGLDAEAVPLDLEQPVRVVERRRDERGEHRRDEGRTGAWRARGHVCSVARAPGVGEGRQSPPVNCNVSAIGSGCSTARWCATIRGSGPSCSEDGHASHDRARHRSTGGRGPSRSARGRRSCSGGVRRDATPLKDVLNGRWLGHPVHPWSPTCRSAR